MPIDTHTFGPAFETILHAGIGLRLFQAFARAIEAPKVGNGGFYRFIYAVTQDLADNKDRLYERRPDKQNEGAKCQDDTLTKI